MQAGRRIGSLACCLRGFELRANEPASGEDRMMRPIPAAEDENSHRGDPGPFEIVAMASSAGGLSALSQVLSELPASFVPVVVVQHLDPRHRSLMAEILGRRTAMRVREAKEGDVLEAGTAYIAPPDRHLLVHSDGSLSLTQTELVHFVRPSADLLFESVAASYRDRAIAVVLTGSGSDGRMGVSAIKKMGGTVIAQDRASSEFFGMPGAAIDTGVVDLVLALDEIAGALVSLVAGGEAS
jgi:two-component system chemotaxis response regulator CheB